jgi:peptidoglycan/xylan/chitin deacetylase (PgdA/CDA1 family)
MFIKTMLQLRAPAGPHARLSTLIFHRVLPAPDPLFPSEVDAKRFDAMCHWVKQWFNVLPLPEAAQRLKAGDLPARAMAITFDDGYADNRTHAAPILQKHGLSATFFVATGFLDGGRMWNDTLIEAVRACTLPALPLSGLHPTLAALPLGRLQERQNAIASLIQYAKYLPVQERQHFVDAVATRAEVHAPTDLMMRSDQVRELRSMGMQVGAHTVSHPILRTLTRAHARQEVETSKQVLQRLLGEPVELFAYPNGKPGEDYSLESVEVVREAGFSTAVSTHWGVSSRSTDPLQLRRFTPWDVSRWRFAMRLWANARQDPHR